MTTANSSKKSPACEGDGYQLIVRDAQGVDYLFPPANQEPMMVLPRVGEEVVLTDGPDAEIIAKGIVRNIQWVIDIKSHAYSVFIILGPLPPEPAAIRVDVELEQWASKFLQDLHMALDGRISNRIILGITRTVFNIVEHRGDYRGDIRRAFAGRDGALLNFAEWATALTDGTISDTSVKRYIEQVGRTSLPRLKHALREWKKSQ